MDRPALNHSAAKFHLACQIGRLALLALLIPALLSCSFFENNKLRAVKSAGELVVLTRLSPTTYYATPDGPAGFEYDLVRGFADYLGVKPRFIIAEKFSDILPRLIKGEANMAAAGITDTESRRKLIRFAPSYQEISQQVIYRLGNNRPASAQELIGRQIEVPAGTSYVERLNELKQEYPELKWNEVDKDSEQLLQAVWEGLLEISIADSNVVAINRQYFPELQVAFTIQKPQSLAWAFPLSEDNSLYEAATKYLEKKRASGELAQLIDRYYGPASQSNFINISVYKVRLRNRLPQYQLMFEKAGKDFNLDWRLLAAIGYQESYWDPLATSPTGVRGLMMLTKETAEELEIIDRLDPTQSIDGGARYFSGLLERIPIGITGPDRIWMALAAYNIGISHLEDARILAQKKGRDPNKWSDVKDSLPLLAEEKWFSKTKYGYARGYEAVGFVNGVRVSLTACALIMTCWCKAMKKKKPNAGRRRWA
ncbi:MAG: membrane-bound lytic murein transglycosylase MltF [Gammaproteobacteria bacterium]|nr:membrane-bound lytic murein transglycosylase MltF [Gammaproteobacteria bacterium]